MRLTLSALAAAVLLAGPALAHDHHREEGPPPPYADMPPPPPPYDHGYGHGRPDVSRWERMREEWAERCRSDRHDDDYDDREPPRHRGCERPGVYAYPGAYMGYAVPMVMVPVLRSKPCREVVEEVVEEVTPVRRRVIRPRARIVPDKRIPLHDKRVPMTPSKRIPY